MAFPPRFILFVCAVVALVTIPLARAATVDFSGTWKLDAKRSDFAQLPVPPSLTDRVTQQPRELVINRDRGGEPVSIHVPLDGSESENTIRGMATKTRGHFTSDALVIDYDTSRRGAAIHSEERWTKSPDGRILTVKRHISGPQDETDQTLIMVRQ